MRWRRISGREGISDRPPCPPRSRSRRSGTGTVPLQHTAPCACRARWCDFTWNAAPCSPFTRVADLPPSPTPSLWSAQPWRSPAGAFLTDDAAVGVLERVTTHLGRPRRAPFWELPRPPLPDRTLLPMAYPSSPGAVINEVAAVTRRLIGGLLDPRDKRFCPVC
jgi:hypothetical protein